MSDPQENQTKRLAELKSYLEKKVSEHESEVRSLKSYLETVDSLLTEKSYRRLKLPATTENQPTTQPIASTMVPQIIRKPVAEPIGNAPQTIRTISGVALADIFVEGRDMRIVPSKEIKFDVNAPPLRSFLVTKVLEPLKVKDEEATRKSEMTPDDVLAYDIDKEGSMLKEIHVKNYGDERRLNELKNALRWTFRRMYEKTIGTQ